jgi:hypothetical protein
MQDDQNGPKIMVLESADMARQTHSSADANTTKNLRWFSRKILHFY